jgi:hypothetical protein
MTIDIFQYSNMYTLRKSIQWLADEAHVKDECGPFVIKEGKRRRTSTLLALGLHLTYYRKRNPRLARIPSSVFPNEAGKDRIRVDAGPRRAQPRHRC